MKKLAILIHDDRIDRVHYALVVAATAAAMNQTVSLFFAGRAILALKADAGWHGLGPTQDGRTPASFDTEAQQKGVVGFEELIDSCRELGATFLCCEMAARLEGLSNEDFRDDLSVEVAGAATFLAKAGDEGRLLSF